MSQLSIRIIDHGVKTVNEKLILALQRLPAGIMRPILEESAKEASGGYSGGNSYAVAELPGQGYVRTGRYGGNQKLEYTGGQSYRLTNRTPYSVYVSGDAYGGGQARVHAGRWPLLRAVMEKAVERIVQAAGEAFNRIISGGGVGL